MEFIERNLIDFILNFIGREEFNNFIRDPRNVSIIIGGLVSVSGAVLGSFLLLRKMAMTTDAISHTVLLGIAVAFLFFQDLASPWLIIGAAVSGVVTVVVTELIFKSGLVKEDAALGLAFPFLFAVAIIIISRFIDDVHLDTDSVMVGEIGVAWANTNSYCFESCEEVVITPEDARARTGRQCVNCSPGGITPFSDEAEFEETCANCGIYTAAEAWRERLIDAPPVLAFWPESITPMLLIMIVNLGFVGLLYKELKLATFDPALAAASGLRPGLLHYSLMVLVSLTAVGAFDAVGSILVVAFFVIPPATIYLLSDRLSVMVIGSPLIGIVAAVTGYEFARGNFLWLVDMNRVLEGLDGIMSLNGFTTWNTSISASMVLMMFVFFLLAWVLSPQYGLVSAMIRRGVQRRRFADQVVMGHIYHHQDTQAAADELAVDTLYRHFEWPRTKMQSVLTRLRALNLVQVSENHIRLTERGQKQVENFQQELFAARR